MRNIIFSLLVLTIVQNAHAVGAYREVKSPEAQAIADAKQALVEQLKFNVTKKIVSVCDRDPAEVYLVEVKVNNKTVQTYAVGQADVSVIRGRTPNVIAKDASSEECRVPAAAM